MMKRSSCSLTSAVGLYVPQQDDKDANPYLDVNPMMRKMMGGG